MDWVSRNYSRGAVFLFPIRRGLWSRRRFVLDSAGSALYPHVLWLPVPGRREGNPARPAQDHNRLYPYYPSPLHYFLALGALLPRTGDCAYCFHCAGAWLDAPFWKACSPTWGARGAYRVRTRLVAWRQFSWSGRDRHLL